MSTKRIGIVLSIATITAVFIYTMSFISVQNRCTGVRIYECMALEKQKAEAKQLAQEEAAAVLLQKQKAEAELVQQQAAPQLQQQVQPKVNTRTKAS